MMLAKLLGFYMQLYEANYRAAAKAALGINLQTLGGFLTVGGGLSVLILGYGVIEFAFSQFIFAVINNILYGGIGLSLLPERKRFKGQYSKSVAKDIFSKGFGYLMNPMWQVVLFQGTTLIIRLSLGPASVAMFNTVRTLSRSVNQMYSVINGGIFPEIQILLGQGNYLKAKSIFIKALKITGVLAVVGLIIMSTIGLPIYSYWTKNELNPPYILWFLMIAATAVNAIWWTSDVIFRALNKPYQFSTAGLVASVISVVLSFVLAKSIGIIGVGIGCLVFELIMATYILPVGLKLLKNEN
jgi:O-antigen/teichoic acid export membrane protein